MKTEDSFSWHLKLHTCRLTLYHKVLKVSMKDFMVFLGVVLKYISKLQARFAIFCDNFPNFSPTDVFSLEMDSQVYEDNFQLFPATKKENLDRETDVGKFDVFCKMHFYA